MANVITMKEREAGKKKRGFAKFKENAKRVGKKVGAGLKKVGAGLKKGAAAAGRFAIEAAKDPLVQKAAIAGASYLANQYLPGSAAFASQLLYGASKPLKSPANSVVDIQMEKVNDKPHFFQNKPFAEYNPPMAHNPAPVRIPPGYKVPNLSLPTDNLNEDRFGRGANNTPIGRHPLVPNKKK